MVLYIIGLGLYDEKDITVKGLEAVRRCDKVYLENYTAILHCAPEKLSAFYEKEVIVADREFVESGSDECIDFALEHNVAFLVVGDPFAATTHTDLMTRCHEKGVRVEVIHNASIMNAVAACGLQLYNFGRTVSICFFTDEWRPDSFYDKIKANRDIGLHTLCLLDIKVKEQSLANLLRGRKIYEPPRFMTVNQCAQQLLEVEQARGGGICGPTARAIGLARVGAADQMIVSGPLAELLAVDFGAPLHALVLVAETDHVEDQMLAFYSIKPTTPRVQAAPAAPAAESQD